jgi:hypothetical protein
VRCGGEGEDGDGNGLRLPMLSLLRPSRGRCASVDCALVVAGGRGRAIAARDDALTLPRLLFPASSIYSLTRIAYCLVYSIATRYHVVAPAISYLTQQPGHCHSTPAPALTLPPEATPTPRRARPWTTLPILQAFACTTAPDVNGTALAIAPRRCLPTNTLRPWFS